MKKRERGPIQKEGNAQQEQVYTMPGKYFKAKGRTRAVPGGLMTRGSRTRTLAGKRGTEYSLSPAKT